MNIETIIHRWANQIKPSGKCGNVFYEGRTLYSYGHHFVLGHWLKHPAFDGGDERIVVLNTESYSISTSRHQSWADRSIPSGAIELRIPLADHRDYVRGYTDRNPLSPEGLMRHAHARIIALSQRVSTRAPRAAVGIQNEAGRLLHAMIVLHEHLGIAKLDTDDAYGAIFSDEVNASIAKCRERSAAREAEARRRARLSQAERQLEKAREFKPDCTPEEALGVLMQAWRDGKLKHTTPFYAEGYNLLRVRDSGVETSGGLRLTWRQLSGAYRCLKLGERVAGYLVQSVTDEVITIGCHRIRWNEISLAVSKLNPEQRELVGATTT